MTLKELLDAAQMIVPPPRFSHSGSGAILPIWFQIATGAGVFGFCGYVIYLCIVNS